MAKVILFDTETTGGNIEDRIIQVGSIIFNDDLHTDMEIFDELCSCEIVIKYDAMAVHHITLEQISNKPPFIKSNFFKRLNKLNSEENFLVAHNLPFNLSMINKEGFFPTINLIDTLRCAKHLLLNSKKHALQYLRYSQGFYKDENNLADKYNITIKAHDAIGDVLVMKLLFDKLYEEAEIKFPYDNPLEKLVSLTKTPVLLKTFYFGKYKDQLIEDIALSDLNYLN